MFDSLIPSSVRNPGQEPFFRSGKYSRGERQSSIRLRRACRALLFLLLLATPALAQDNLLTEPVELCPGDDGILKVNLEVKFTTFTGKKVRAYHLMSGGSWKLCNGETLTITDSIPMTPGPTFRLRRKDASQAGSKFQMTLHNNLKPTSANHDCNFAHNQYFPPQGGVCTDAMFEAQTNALPQTWPSCFHGDNVTNFHYHGFHISPQPHQDWVLLSLYPAGSTGVSMEPGGIYPSKDIANAVGSYEYDLDRLPDIQAEGTHWYHPHKHGSTALQVLNGMAGTFVIEGPFDDWLNGQYETPLEDKVLVVQQIDSEENFYNKKTNGSSRTYSYVKKDNPDEPCTASGLANIDKQCLCKATPIIVPPATTINGDQDPIIEMAPGEIQRWRFVGATMNSSAQLNIGFDPNFRIRQIAQDGVQFAKENYENQPLLQRAWFIQDQPNQVLTNYQLAPGNRGDFLVKAPLVSERTCYGQVQEVTGRVNQLLRPMLRAQAQELIARVTKDAPETQLAAQSAPLLRVCVDPSKGMQNMKFPAADQWPAMPTFLENLPDPGDTTTVAFSMTKPAGTDPTSKFYIDGVEYCSNCANQTLSLDTTVQWQITNDTALNHPFHIHVNPFQLLEHGNIINGTPVPFQTYDPPIWQDVIALPILGDGVNSCSNVNAGPIWNNNDAKAKCEAACPTGSSWDGNWITTQPGKMSVCKCCAPKGSDGYAKIRQKPRQFTGEFVIHCHILGHEDRGMMQNVQTVCPNGKFGTPKSDGQSECVDGEYIDPALQCPDKYETGSNCGLPTDS